MPGLEDLISILKKEKEDNVKYSPPWKAVIMTLFILAFAFVYESYRIEDIFRRSLAELPEEKERNYIEQLKGYYFRNVIYLTIEVNQYKKKIGFDHYQKNEKRVIDKISEPIVLFGNGGKDTSDNDKVMASLFNEPHEKLIFGVKKEDQYKEPIKETNKQIVNINEEDVKAKISLEKKMNQLQKTSVKSQSTLSQQLNKSMKKLKPPYKVLMIGDSQMEGYIGIYIQRKFGKTKGKVLRKGIQSTGLALPKYYNWPKKLQGFIKTFKPNVLVVMLGTNDFHALYSIDKKRYFRFGTPEWKEEYTKATQKVAELAKKHNIVTFWLGIPLTEKASLNTKIKKVNDIQIEALKKYKNVYYYSLWNLFDQNMKTVKKYIKNNRGRKIRIRAKDGIHFAPTAAKKAVEEITEYMSRFINLT